MGEFESVFSEGLRIFLQIFIPLTAAPVCAAIIVAVIGKFIQLSDEAVQYSARAISVALVVLALGGAFFGALRGLLEFTFVGAM